MDCIVILCDTLRRDHCGPYHRGRPLSAVGSEEQPDWVVPTPNMDRLAERSTVFENAYNGSTPCAPARRDIYTGRYDFLERAWGPLEPDGEDSKLERHFRNVALTRDSEEDHFAAQVFQEAADWIDTNHAHEDFYLHVDCFDPHEPWDPPEELVEQFDPRGYDVEEWDPLPAYDEWADHYDEDDLRHIQARYAARVVLVDRWLGRLLDALDRNDCWEDTMVVFTTDHGTFNGDMGRTGKFHGGTDTHNHEACAHIPFIVAHPEYGRGERREQLVQLVDVYPTVLNAVGRPIPEDRHGMDLTPVLRDPDAELREYAISGLWGASVTITDGDWVLHQAPEEGNDPLYWYGITGETDDSLGPYDPETGRREADEPYPLGKETWLSDKREDSNELVNLADERPEKHREMQRALERTLDRLDAPPEQAERLGIAGA